MKTAINIKVDKKVKRESQILAEEIGLTLSSVINASLKQFVRNREVSFSVGHKMTSYLENIIGEAEKELKNGKIPKPVPVKEFIKSLK